MTMTNKDARESSIFHMLGLAFHWRLDRLASFYKVTPYQMEMWLGQMGMTSAGIGNLKQEYTQDGVCYSCIMAVEQDKVFCSDECARLTLRKRLLLNKIEEHGIVPVTYLNHTFYNVNTSRMERTHVTS